MSLNKNTIPKPNFIIVGSAKCGTTTLSDVLATYPDCCFSNPKEVRFFDLDENYNKGWAWYQQAFSHYNGEKMVGEATPNYTAMPLVSQCAERIYQFNPETKIIYIVRHPYKRLVSSWKMHYRNSSEKAHKEACQGFEHYLKQTQKKYNYLDHCLFDYQLEAYRKLFPRKTNIGSLSRRLDRLSRRRNYQTLQLFRFRLF